MEEFNKTIVFFYPSKVVGGAEYLFMRSALFMAEQMNLKVQYIDYADGFVARELSGSKSVEFIVYSDLVKVKLKENQIVICPFSSAFWVNISLKGNYSILFWSIHPAGLYERVATYCKFSRFKYTDFTSDINALLNHNAVVFMDGSNVDYQRDKFNFSLHKEDFLPIFCLEKQVPLVSKKVPTATIHLGWLGRLCIEKVNPLINVLRHLKLRALTNHDQQFIFHIIGDGECRYLVEKESLPRNVSICFHGVVTGAELYDFIYQNIDVMFGMGTSTLEVASLKKAIILVDLSFEEMQMNNQFRWLYESTRYSVGDEYKKEVVYNHSFDEVIDVITNGKLAAIENECYNYFKQYHTIEHTCNELYHRAVSSTLDSISFRKTKFNKVFIYGILFKIKRFKNSLLK
ncbi:MULTISPECIES: hypothetical protein [Myroides]|uniref:Uncharacterized protein n=1 Tax=Myroides albus TaxID=2562892 RepID=A0A6I3LK89_9FLAO|nr:MULTISPECIES: hypothetical protein [Myroides]MTG98723.1 hypothetical protein [Myroides albus]MVX37138.1 hypothetical protein [Myroides sp. LoEW2-1]UVD79078.1 hypothetical protein NWE55_13230 [Myroides albus]